MMGGESEPLRVLNEFWPVRVAISGASLPHSMHTELGPALDHVSVVRGEGFQVGGLVVAALVTVLTAATRPSANHCWS